MEKFDIQKTPNLQDDVTQIMYSYWLPKLNSLVILCLLRTPSSLSQYPVTFQQRCRLLSSFSQLCATGDYGCPWVVLLCKSFSFGRRGSAGWYMTLLLFPVPQVGLEKRQDTFLLIKSVLPFCLVVLSLKVIFCGMVHGNRLQLKYILHTTQPYLTGEEHMALSYYLLFQGNQMVTVLKTYGNSCVIS